MGLWAGNQGEIGQERLPYLKPAWFAHARRANCSAKGSSDVQSTVPQGSDLWPKFHAPHWRQSRGTPLLERGVQKGAHAEACQWKVLALHVPTVAHREGKGGHTWLSCLARCRFVNGGTDFTGTGHKEGSDAVRKLHALWKYSFGRTCSFGLLPEGGLNSPIFCRRDFQVGNQILISFGGFRLPANASLECFWFFSCWLQSPTWHCGSLKSCVTHLIAPKVSGIRSSEKISAAWLRS